MALVAEGARQTVERLALAQANAGHLARRHVFQQQLGLHEGQRAGLGRNIQAVLGFCHGFLPRLLTTAKSACASANLKYIPG
jgi:hypothetical protein